MPDWPSGRPTRLLGTTPEEILISFFFFFIYLFFFYLWETFLPKGPTQLEEVQTNPTPPPFFNSLTQRRRCFRGRKVLEGRLKEAHQSQER